MESAQTWPVRSTCSAELIEIIRSFRAITNGSFTTSVGRNSKNGLSFTKSYSRRDPMQKDVTAFPGWNDFRRQLMVPDSIRSTTPSRSEEHTSELQSHSDL